MTELGHLRPPRRLAGQSGAGDFFEIGDLWRDRLRRWADLQPHEHVLEIGCGIGRVAAGLASYLEPPGRYEGFDVNRRAVRWCRRAIAREWPSASFRHVDVVNSTYHRRGRVDPSHFRFPYDDGSFDVVVATSVYTHMGHSETAHYLAETARVLRPGGKAFATFFLVGEGTPALDHRADFEFEPSGRDRHWVAEPDRPMMAVAHPLDAIEAALAEAGLEVVDPVHFGEWRLGDERTAMDYQDVVVASLSGPV